MKLSAAYYRGLAERKAMLAARPGATWADVTEAWRTKRLAEARPRATTSDLGAKLDRLTSTITEAAAAIPEPAPPNPAPPEPPAPELHRMHIDDLRTVVGAELNHQSAGSSPFWRNGAANTGERPASPFWRDLNIGIGGDAV